MHDDNPWVLFLKHPMRVEAQHGCQSSIPDLSSP